MLDQVTTFITTFVDEAPWWIYVLAVLIPAFLLLALRESYCWFNKVNGVNKKLAKLDRTLNLILKELKTSSQRAPQGVMREDKPKIIQDTKFSLKKDEDFKLK